MAAKTIDEYLEAVPPEQRKALARLRKQIRSAAPDADECISYGVPAFRQGTVLCGFAAMKKHCGFYMFGDTTLDAFRDELSEYSTAKGTIRFQPDKPLPADLVKRLVKARLAERNG